MVNFLHFTSYSLLQQPIKSQNSVLAKNYAITQNFVFQPDRLRILLAAVDNFPSNSYLNSPVANDTLVDFGVGNSWASVEGLLNSGDRGSVTDSCNGGSLSNSVASRGSSDSSIASRAGSSIAQGRGSCVVGRSRLAHCQETREDLEACQLVVSWWLLL